MNRLNGITEGTEAEKLAYQRALGIVLRWAPIAPHATAPYDRPENADRRVSIPRATR